MLGWRCAAIALAILPAPASADEACPPEDGDVAVVLAYEIPDIKIEHGRTREDLGGLMVHGPGERVLGIMHTRLERRTYFGFGSKAVAGGHCLWVESIAVHVGHDSLDVYVAAEYPEGSCQYQAILDHEQRHVGIFGRFFDAYDGDFRAALAHPDIPTPRRPLFAADLAAVEKRIGDRVQALIEPVFDSLQRGLDEAQAEIDSPVSYAGVRAQCRTW